LKSAERLARIPGESSDEQDRQVENGSQMFFLIKFWFFALLVEQTGYHDPVSRSRFDKETIGCKVDLEKMRAEMK